MPAEIRERILWFIKIRLAKPIFLSKCLHKHWFNHWESFTINDRMSLTCRRVVKRGDRKKSCYIFSVIISNSSQNTQQMRVKILTTNEAISTISIRLPLHTEHTHTIKIQQKLLKWFKDVFLSFENCIRGTGVLLCSERPDGKHTMCVHTAENIYLL